MPKPDMPRSFAPKKENLRASNQNSGPQARRTFALEENPFRQDDENLIEKFGHHSLKEMEGLDPETEVVFQTNLDSTFRRATVRQLREEVAHMGDAERSRHHGLPYAVFIESVDPDAFFAERQKLLRSSQLKFLKQLEAYPNDQLVWYVFPNEGPRPIKTTAGQLRRMLWDYDEGLHDMISHAGGIQIVSTDPDFDPERYELEGAYVFGRLVKGQVDRVNERHGHPPEMPPSPKDLLLAKLLAMDPDAQAKYRLPGSKKILKTTVGKLRKKILLLTPQDMETQGLPELVENRD